MWQDAMTSEKAMLTGRCLLLWALLLAIGCSNEPKMDRPSALSSPYPGPKLWAVVPLRNESGTTLVDTVRLADKLTQALGETRGITIVPVNRVLAAMQAAEMEDVASVGDAFALMQRLGVDGLIVGSLHAWDPYEPPKIGATIALISRRADRPDEALDSRQLTYAATGDRPGLTISHSQPVAQASGYFDAANHQVLADVREYAIGRTPLESPSGWRRYLLSMDLYTEYVSYTLTRQLLESEWRRMNATAPADAAAAAAAAAATD
jgi:hypothetical protein